MEYEPLIYLRVNRVPPELCARARAVSVADLHENTGHLAYTGLMTSAIHRVTPGTVVGPAVTALCRAGDNLMAHRALSLAQPGDVLVVVCQGESAGAVWGDLATRFAQARGVSGVIVQGCVRDVDAVAALGFPVWASDVSPAHADKGKLGAVNVPIVCGGVRVHPGDLVAADGDGVLVVERRHAERVVAGAEIKMRREEDVARRIEQGEMLWNLTGSAQAFELLGATEVDAAYEDPTWSALPLTATQSASRPTAAPAPQPQQRTRETK
ncbi:RraA family protein [Hydrogenophaga sp.]|uniref:RraA family protein n=1 Tax=Hydrogenophaga sp. TaxID=1904254 RepID=UPI0027259302|nr:RraA family protein [Hydrogenophaga sp.]MDO9437020.1 RraA family protein [Hydrogenophaga sp.]